MYEAHKDSWDMTSHYISKERYKVTLFGPDMFERFFPQSRSLKLRLDTKTLHGLIGERELGMLVFDLFVFVSFLLFVSLFLFCLFLTGVY